MGTPARTARSGSSTPVPVSERRTTEGQLVAGQWVDVSMEDLPTPVLLSAFVLSLRSSEVLLTFPELLEPPEGLEAEARVSVRYSNSSGSFAATGVVARVASGPPVTVTLERLVLLTGDPRRAVTRSPAAFSVRLQVLSSRVAPPVGPEGIPGAVRGLSDSGMVLKTSLLLAVGDTVRVVPLEGPEFVRVQGRVVAVSEGEAEGQFGVDVEFVHETPDDRECWSRFAARWQSS